MDESAQVNTFASMSESRLSESSTQSRFDPVLRELLADSVRLFAGLDDAALDVLLALSRQPSQKSRHPLRHRFRQNRWA